jgi:hypothetical protein
MIDRDTTSRVRHAECIRRAMSRGMECVGGPVDGDVVTLACMQGKLDTVLWRSPLTGLFHRYRSVWCRDGIQLQYCGVVTRSMS